MGPFTACDPEAPVTRGQLKALERYLDAVWEALGVDIRFTRHFFDRVNDPRNGDQITICELQQIFTDAMRQHGSTLIRIAKNRRGDMEGVLKSVGTQINTPFVLQYNPGDQEFELVTKTVMRKARFLVPGGQKQFKVEGTEMGPFEQSIESRFSGDSTTTVAEARTGPIDDPAEEAASIINMPDPLSQLRGILDDLDKEFKGAKQDLKGHQRAGMGLTGTTTILKKRVHRLLKSLSSTSGYYADRIEELDKAAARGGFG